MHRSWLYHVVFLLPFFLFEALSFSSGLLDVLLPGQPGARMVVAVAAAVIDIETKFLDTISKYLVEQLVHKPEDGEIGFFMWFWPLSAGSGLKCCCQTVVLLKVFKPLTGSNTSTSENSLLWGFVF